MIAIKHVSIASFLVFGIILALPTPSYAERLRSNGAELNAASGNEFSSHNFTIQGTTVRSGSYAAQVTSLSSGVRMSGNVLFAASNDNGPYYCRTYFRYATAPSAENAIVMVENDSSTSIAWITVDGSGILRLYDEDGAIGSASAALSSGTWYRIEILVDASGSGSTDTVRARIDGVEFAGASNRNLSTGVARFYVGGNIQSEAQTTGNWYFDDIAVNDTTGSNQTSWPGPGKIDLLRPNAAGDNSQWTIGAGSGSNYQVVDEITPNGATDYVNRTATNGGTPPIDDYNVQDSSTMTGYSSSTSIINLVHVGGSVGATSATTSNDRDVYYRIKGQASGTVLQTSSGIDWSTASTFVQNVDPNPRNYQLTAYTNPQTSTAWTSSSIDSLQIGIQPETDSTTEVRCSALWAAVDWKPGVTVSGTVYTDEGSSTITGNKTVSIKVNGAGTYTGKTYSGVYSISDVPVAAGDVITVFLSGETEDATTVTRAANSTSDISGLNLYQNFVIIRTEDSGPMTIDNLNNYDYADAGNADVQFTATNASPDTLTVNSGNTLYVMTSTTVFTPGGNITTPKYKQVAGVFDLGSNTMTLSGSGTGTSRPFFVSAGTFTASTSTIDYQGTSTSDVQATTYYDLKLGVVANATASDYNLMSGTTTVTHVMTVGDAGESDFHNANAGSGVTLIFTGSGRPLVIGNYDFSLLECSSGSVVRYTGTSATTISATDYWDLELKPAGTVTYQMDGDVIGLFIQSLTVGDGTNALTLSNSTYNPTIYASTVTVASNATFSGTGTNWLVVTGGSMTGDGTVNFTNCNVRLDPAGNFGGATAWTFYDLTFGDGSGATTTTSTGSGGITVSHVMTIAASQTLDAKGKTWTLSGTTGTPFVITGTLNDSTDTSTFTFTGNNGSGNTTVPASTAYNNIILNNGSETFVTNGTTTLSGDLTVTAGILSSAHNITVNGGDITGNGTITHTANTVTINTAGNFGGDTAWTLYNLTIGAAGNATTTATGTGGITVSNVLTIDTGDTLDAGSKTYTLSKAGTGASRPFINSGTFTASSSTVNYTGSAATAVEATTYYNLGVGTTSDGGAGVTYSLSSTTTTVQNQFTIGNAASTNNDNATLTASGTLILQGSGTPLNVTDHGIYVGGQFGNTTTTRFTGTSNTTIPDTNADYAGAIQGYGNLEFLPASGSPTYTLGSAGGESIYIIGNWTIGSGTTMTVDQATNSPAVYAHKNVTLASNASYTKGGTLTIFDNSLSYQNHTLTDSNSTKQDLGNVHLDCVALVDTCNSNLTLGSDVKATKLIQDVTVPDFETISVSLVSYTLTLTGSGTGASRPFYLDSATGGTFTEGTGTIAYTGTSATEITAETYYNMTLAPSGAGSPTYTLGTASSQSINVSNNLVLGDATNAVTVSTSTYSPAVTVTGDVTVNANATLSGSGTGNFYVNGGDTTGSGTISFTGGTFRLDTTGNFGGSTAWTFYNLTFGDGSGVTTTTATGAGGITVSNVLTVAASQTFNASSKTYTLSGSGTPLAITGTLTSGGTFIFTGTTNTTIPLNCIYKNLQFTPPSGTPTYTLGTGASQTMTVQNGSWTIGSGVTVQADTYDPVIHFLSGNTTSTFTISSGATFTKSADDTGYFSLESYFAFGGKIVLIDNNATKQDLGVCRILGVSDGGLARVELGSSIKVSKLLDYTDDEVASPDLKGYTLTLTGSGTGSSRPLQIPASGANGGTFTASAGTVEYVGTAATEINPETYYNLSLIPAGTVTHTLGTAASQTITVSNNLIVGNGTNAVTVNADSYDPILDVNGSVTIAASGTLVASNSAAFTVAANFTNNGTFTHSSGTITFDTTATSTIAGSSSTTFNNFTCTTQDKTLQFKAHSGGVPVITFAGTLTITGASGHLINLYSDASGTQWKAHANATQSSISYANVRDAGCDTGTSNFATANSNPVSNNDTCWRFGITYAGVVYTDEGTTPMATGPTVRIKINGGGSYSATADGSGVFSVNNISVSDGQVVTAYLDTNGGNKAVTVTRASGTSDISGLNLYQDRVIVRHEDAGPTSNANLDQYDSTCNSGTGDTDIPYCVNGGNLTVSDGTKLIVWTGKTFTPGGTVITDPSSSAASVDGDLTIQSGATLSMETNALSIGGDFTNSGSFSTTGDVTFKATSTGHVIHHGTANFNSSIVQLGADSGSTGGWSFDSAAQIKSMVVYGALTGTNDITIADSTEGVIGDGVINLTGGTFTKGGAGLFGDSSNWTFYNLAFTGAFTTTAQLTSSITVTNQMTIGAGHTLDAAGKTWILSKSGTGASRPFINSGTFTASASTVSYTGTATTDVEATTYFNLKTGAIANAIATNYNLMTGTTTVANVMTIGIVGETNNHFANMASGATLIFTGSGTPLVIANTTYSILECSGGIARYTGTSATTITASDYYDLELKPAGTVTYQVNGAPFGLFSNSITVGDGTNALTLSTTTYSPNIWSHVLTVASGSTFSGSGGGVITLNSTGTITGDGTINFTNGEVVVDGTGTFGGATAWTFYDLTFGDGSGVTTTTATGVGGITVSDVMSILASQTLDAKGKTWTLSGTDGTPLGIYGTLNDSLDTSTFSFTGNNTGGNTTIPASTGYNNITLNNSSETFVTAGTTTLSGDLTVTAGILSSAHNITVNGGDITGDGTITHTAGTFLLDGTGNFGGDTAWTFYNLTFGDGSGTTTSTASGAGAITISNVLTIAASQTLDATSKTWTLPKAGTGASRPFINSGTFTASTSTVSYTGTVSVEMQDTTYYNLNAGVIANGIYSDYNFKTGTTTISNVMTIGHASATNVHSANLPASSTLILSGSGTPIVMISMGAFEALSDSTVRYTGTSPTNVAGGNASYINLELTPAGTVTYQLGASASEAVGISGNLTVGNGTNALTLSTTSFNPDIQVNGNMTVAANSTLSGSGSGEILLYGTTGGGATGDGTINLTAGNFAIQGTNNFGGNTAWTFHDLNIGGSGAYTTTATGSGSITVSDILTIQASQTLDAKGKTWTLSGTTGTPLDISGTLNDSTDSSTFTFTGNNGSGNTTVPASTAYNNIILNNGSETFVTAGTTTLSGDLTVTAGILSSAHSVTVNGGDITGNGTITHTAGTFTINTVGTFGGDTAWTFYNLTIGGSGDATTTATGTGGITVSNILSIDTGDTLNAGSKTYTLPRSGGGFGNTGTFTASTSTVNYTATSGPATIRAATYYNLGVGTTSDSSSVYYSPVGNITVTNVFTIGNASSTVADAFQPAAHTITLSGSGNPLNITSKGRMDLLTDAGELKFTGTADTTVPNPGSPGLYPSLTLQPSGAGNPRYTFASGTIPIYGNLTLGDGTNAVTVNLETNDPILQVAKDFTISNGATFEKSSNAATVQIDGEYGTLSEHTLTDNNATKQDLGEVYLINGASNLYLATDAKMTKFSSDNSGGTLDLNGAHTLTFTGSGTGTSRPFYLNGATFTPSTGTVTYTGTAASEIESTTYNNLSVMPGANTVTHTALAGTLTVTNDLIVGDGTNTGTFNINTNDPVLDVNGSVTIAASGTLVASNSAAFTVAANFTNNGTFTHSSGTITFDTTATSTIAGSSSTTFNNFTCTTQDKTLQFKAHSGGVPVITFAGTLTITGASGHLINLYSDASGTQWKAHANATQSSISYANVRDAGCDTGTSNFATANSNPVSNNDTCWRFGITYEGIVYTNEGTTAMGSGRTVRIKINGGGTYSGTTDGSGAYLVNNLSVSVGQVVTAYLDGAAEKAVTVTRAAGGGDLTGLNLYQDRVIVRHEDAGPTSNANLDQYDSACNSGTGDSDIPFCVNAGTLTVADGTKLIVWTGKTFTPGGTVITDPSSSAASTDGDLTIQSGATLSMETNALSIGGDFVNSGTFSESGSPQVTTFTATATGHTIDNGTGNLDNVTFNGSGGGWSFSDASNTISGDLTMTAGTLSGSNSLTVNGGDVTGNGTINHGGSFTINTAGNFGGDTAWTFGNLTIGAAGNATTTATGTGGITVSNVLTIDTGDTLDAGPKTYYFIKSGVGASRSFINNGTFTASSSTVSYSTAFPCEMQAATYYNLNVGVTANPNTTTYNFQTGTTTVSNVLTIGYASALGMQTANLPASGILVLSGSGTPLVINTNHGSFIGDGGSTVRYTSTSATNITGGNAEYSDLELVPAGTVTYQLGTFASDSLPIVNLTVGNGTNTLTLSTSTYNPIVWISGNLTMASNAILSGSGTETISVDGNVTGDGTINLTSGIFRLDGTGNFGGATAWTFYDLTFGDGSGVTTTTATGAGGITVTDVLTIAASQTLSAGSKTYTLSGATGTPLVVSGTFTGSTSTVAFTGNYASGNTTIPALTTYNSITLNNGSETFVTAGTTTLSGDLTVTAGILSSAHNITVNGGDITGDGTITHTANTVVINTAGNFGGDTAWTFYNLTVGAAGNATTTATGTGGITVSNVLTIDTGDTLDAGSKTYTLSKAGTGASRPFINNGTFTASTSTVSYTGTFSVEMQAATYYNLNAGVVADAISTDYSFQVATTTVNHVMTIGDEGESDIHSATLPASGVLVLAGSGAPLVLASWGIFECNTGSTVRYTSTSATNVVGGAIDYYNLELIPAGTVTYQLGAISLDSVSVLGNLTVGNGTNALTLSTSTYNASAYMFNGDLIITTNATVSGTGTGIVRVDGGDMTGDGTVNLTAGTVRLDTTGNFGGATAWTFYDLTFGDGSGVTTTTATGAGGITVSHVLTIAASQTLNAGPKTWTLSGTGSPFTITGTFTPATSTIQYSGTTATVTTSTYNNLTLGGTGAYTMPGSTFTLRGDLLVTLGSTVTKGAGVVTFAKGGTQTITDNTVSTQDIGTCQVSANTTNTTLNLASSASMTKLTVDASQTFSTQANTLILTGAGTGASRPFVNNGTFTQSTGTVNYIGDGFTTITAATYYNLGVGTTADTNPGRVYSLNGDTTVQSVFTIGNAASSAIDGLSTGYTVTFSGSGTPLVVTSKGSFNPGAIYTGTSNTNIAADRAYYNGLQFSPASGTPTYTLGTAAGQTMQISGNAIGTLAWTIGSGVTVQADTWDPIIDIQFANVTLNSGSTFVPSSDGTGYMKLLTYPGFTESITVTDNNATKQDLGVVAIDFDSDVVLGSSITVTRMLGFISDESLDLNGNTLTITGSGTASSRPMVMTSSSTLINNNGTVVYTGSSATEIDPYVTYYNLTLDPASGTPVYTIASNSGQTLRVDGTFTLSADSNVNSDTYDPALDIRGDFILASGAQYTKGSGTLTFKKGSTQTFTDSTASKQDLGDVHISVNSTNTTVNLGSSMRLTNLTIDASQTLNANGANTITVLGNWTNNGTFTAATGTVAFNGTGTQTVAGSSNFYNLQATTSTTRSILFTAGTTQSVASGGSVTFTGASGNLLTLASTSGGNDWNLHADNAIASENIQYVNVSDSNAGPYGTYAEMLASDGTSNDGNNNLNWNFGSNTALGFLQYF